MVGFLLVAIFVGMDQLTKYWIGSTLDPYDSIPIVSDIFHITYIPNDAGAFRLFEGQQNLLIGLTSIFLLVALIYLFMIRHRRHWSLMVSLSLICGGGIGNLIDRLRLGYVVDFLDFRIWPVFNFADMCVVVGCGLLLLSVLVFEPLAEKKEWENEKP